MKYLVRTFLLISGVFLLVTSCSGDGEAPTLSYGTTSYSFPVNTEITPVTATLKGDTPTGCYASPVLPNGLLLDQRTCTISGTPEATQGATTHLITASNDSGSGNATLSIEITAAPGYMEQATIGGIQVNMAYIPGGLTFPVGIDDNGDIDGDAVQDITPTVTITNDYFIGETELTYELWYTVYQWAISNGYTFANTGTEGSLGTAGAASATQEPVTTINWRDAMVWTNALTEYYNSENGASLECVYTSDSTYSTCIRDSSDGTSYGSAINATAGSFDDPYVNPAATGFRLPTADEWELAARYIGTSVPSTGGNLDTDYVALDHNDDGSSSLTSGYYWTPGDYASGATIADCLDSTSIEDVAWYYLNTSYTNDVKTKSANALGLYDMSGNVHEWTFDWHPSESIRMIFGGGWSSSYDEVQIGSRANGTGAYEYTVPYDERNIIGFRLARTP